MKQCLLLGLACSSGLAVAGEFSIGWYKIGSGGGTGTNEQYLVSGTVGAADAGSSMNGGHYTLTGGFWAIDSVSTPGIPGTPALNIGMTLTNTLLIWWPSPSTGFGLQQNADLAGTNWVTPTETLNDDGVNRYVVVTPSPGNRFYRLQHP